MTALQPDARRPAPHVYYISPDIDDLDFMGHVNNSRYLLWLQEAVLDHWKHVAPPATFAETLWIALRHEIEYLKPAYQGQNLIISVQLLDLHGVRASYESCVMRAGIILTKIRSQWCSINASTGRPYRLDRVLQRQIMSGSSD
jgi:acyl-CoA thioester hydrolase